MKDLKKLAVLIVCMIALPMGAQTSCDKLFASGVELQQTMTITSQNKAITYFEKAKVCYDSQAKKDLCDQQITTCKNIIAQLKQPKPVETTSPTPQKDLAPSGGDTTPLPGDWSVINDVQLSIDCVYLKFRGKGDEFKKVIVTCSSPDWGIVEQPDWVNCSKNDRELVVEAVKNPKKEERSGPIIISYGGKSITLIVIQEKNNKADRELKKKTK